METDINKMSDRISNIYLDIFILWIDILASVKLQGRTRCLKAPCTTWCFLRIAKRFTENCKVCVSVFRL